MSLYAARGVVANALFILASPGRLPYLQATAGLGSVHEIRWRRARSVSNAPATPDGVYLDWATATARHSPKAAGGVFSEKVCSDLGFAATSQPRCTLLLPWLARPVPLWTLQPLELGGTCACTFSPHPAMRADAVDLQLETLRHHAASLGRSCRPDGMLCQRHLLSIYPK